MREPLEPTKRAAMTKKRRAELIEMYEGVCCTCGKPADKWEIDHVIPLELGGSDSRENLELLCVPCHRAKTKVDVKRIAKARRLRKKQIPVEGTQRARRILSRGFDKTKTKTFSGKVVNRTPRSVRPNTPARPPSD